MARVDDLLCIEATEAFQKMMRYTQLDAHRFYMAWTQHPEDVFHAFAHRMKHTWKQPYRFVMPNDYAYYSCTHMWISSYDERVLPMWHTLLSLGLAPLYMKTTHTHYVNLPRNLQKTLKAYRLLLRCLRKKEAVYEARRKCSHQRKKMQFMVKCQPFLTLTA